MPQIIFLPHETLCPEGAAFDVQPGETICDAALLALARHNATQTQVNANARK